MSQVSLGLTVTAAQATIGYQEFTAELCLPQASLPPDLTLRVFAGGIPALSGESFLIDNIEVFPSDVAQNPSLVRCSGTEEPEAYDGVTGIMCIAENNGQGIRAAFTIRNNLYFVKERSMYVTASDGINEPALWQVEELPGDVSSLPLGSWNRGARRALERRRRA
jgi:hypothetical protein